MRISVKNHADALIFHNANFVRYGNLCLRAACTKLLYAQKAAQKWGLI